MYEIWLGINILYEMAMDMLPQLISFTVLVALFYFISWRYTEAVCWKKTFRPLCYIGAGCFLILLWLFPLLGSSSITEVGYWMDALLLSGFAFAFAGIAMLLLWPVLSLTLGKKRF